MLRVAYDERGRDGRLTRRELLRACFGGIGGAIATSALAGVPRSGVPRGFGKAKSVILVYASGGQSQLDMWDPKPTAPLDVRGAFKPIATAVAGVHFCEHMPRIAAIADRFTVVRSMSHEDLDHGSATYLALTGRYHARKSSNPPPSPNDFPTYGAVLKRVRPDPRVHHDAVHLNGPALVPELVAPGQNGGLLGREFEPLLIGNVVDKPVVVPGLELQSQVPTVRLNERRTLKQSLDLLHGALAEHRKARDLSHQYQQALEMLSSQKYRSAFDLGSEPRSIRERYGHHRSGQACLLARRLVEAGTPFVTVIWNHSNRGQDSEPDNTDQYGWDTHNDIFKALEHRLLPRFDEGFSALLLDLESRGLLEETLVICMGEFGRAPRVALEPRFKGNAPGRKHWASVYSIVAAGAGVGRGHVLGSSDRLGAEPVSERFGPWDVAATMFSSLGIDPAGEFRDPLDRPFPITIGQPIEGLFV